MLSTCQNCTTLQTIITTRRANEDRLIRMNMDIKKRETNLRSNVSGCKKVIKQLRSLDLEGVKLENQILKTKLTNQAKLNGMRQYHDIKEKYELSSKIETELKKFLLELKSKEIAGIARALITMKLDEIATWE